MDSLRKLTSLQRERLDHLLEEYGVEMEALERPYRGPGSDPTRAVTTHVHAREYALVKEFAMEHGISLSHYILLVLRSELATRIIPFLREARRARAEEEL